ncbi:UNVERIFIED_CONTAM: hypothetical protein FKN15_006276 [Acipenser sinensis]
MFAHRCILACCCEVFHGMFSQQLQSDRPRELMDLPVVLSDVQPEVFLAVIEFLYTNCVTLNNYILCVEFITDTVTVETVCEAMQVVLERPVPDVAKDIVRELRLFLLSPEELARLENVNHKDNLIPVERIAEAWKFHALKKGSLGAQAHLLQRRKGTRPRDHHRYLNLPHNKRGGEGGWSGGSTRKSCFESFFTCSTNGLGWCASLQTHILSGSNRGGEPIVLPITLETRQNNNRQGTGQAVEHASGVHHLPDPGVSQQPASPQCQPLPQHPGILHPLYTSGVLCLGTSSGAGPETMTLMLWLSESLEMAAFLPDEKHELGDAVLFGRHNVGRILALPEPNLAHIQMDTVTAAPNGSLVVHRGRHIDKHYCYVDLTWKEWDGRLG